MCRRGEEEEEEEEEEERMGGWMGVVKAAAGLG